MSSTAPTRLRLPTNRQSRVRRTPGAPPNGTAQSFVTTWTGSSTMLYGPTVDVNKLLDMINDLATNEKYWKNSKTRRASRPS